MKRLAKARNIKSGDGVVLDMKITDLGGGNSIARGGQGANLTGTTNPVTVSLTVGNDGGSTTVNAKFH